MAVDVLIVVVITIMTLATCHRLREPLVCFVSIRTFGVNMLSLRPAELQPIALAVYAGEARYRLSVVEPVPESSDSNRLLSFSRP